MTQFKLKTDSGSVDIELPVTHGFTISDHINVPANEEIEETLPIKIASRLTNTSAAQDEIDATRRLLQIALAKAEEAYNEKRESEYVWLHLIRGSDEIRIALVGCGGRGRGAAENLFKSGGNVKLVAVADAFPKGCSDAIRLLSRRYADMMDVPEDRMFSGLDAYKQAIDVDCDLVVIAPQWISNWRCVARMNGS